MKSKRKISNKVRITFGSDLTKLEIEFEARMRDVVIFCCLPRSISLKSVNVTHDFFTFTNQRKKNQTAQYSLTSLVLILEILHSFYTSTTNKMNLSDSGAENEKMNTECAIFNKIQGVYLSEASSIYIHNHHRSIEG